MKNTVAALALLATGYAAGTVAPHAAALDTSQAVVQELRGIKAELQNIRRALEKGTRP